MKLRKFFRAVYKPARLEGRSTRTAKGFESMLSAFNGWWSDHYRGKPHIETLDREHIRRLIETES